MRLPLARWYPSTSAVATYNRGRIQHPLGVNVPFLRDRDFLLWTAVRELPERVHPSDSARRVDRVAGFGLPAVQVADSLLR